MDPGHKYLPRDWLDRVEEYIRQQEAQMETMAVWLKQAALALERACTAAQSHQPVTARLAITTLPSFSPPASKSVAPTNSAFRASECFAGGSETGEAHTVTFPTDCAGWEWSEGEPAHFSL